MEKLIRKILNFDANSATAEDRDEMCVTVAAISMFLLDKSGKYKDVDTMDIVHKPELSKGIGAYGHGILELNRFIFQNNQTIIDDIRVIAHESCHKSQHSRIDGGFDIDTSTNIYYGPNNYNALLKMIIKYYGFGALTQFMSLEKICDSDYDLRKIYAYFRSFYDLQFYEIEANDFAASVQKYIIENAKKMELSKVEKNNLDKLIQRGDFYKLYPEFINYMMELRQDKEYAKNIEDLLSNVRDFIFKENPFLSNQINNCVSLEISNTTDYTFDLLCLCLSLEIKFDEKLARKIFDLLIVASPNEIRDVLLFNMVFKSKFQITKHDEWILRQIHGECKSRYYKTFSFEKLLSEKERIFAEREAIENGEIDKKYSFNFE